jgi:hypothetical protein
MRPSPLGAATHLRKHWLIRRRQQDSKATKLIQIVRVLRESLVVQSMRKNSLLGLQPDILDGVVEVVAEEEAV